MRILVEDERDPLPGYDFTFAPSRPLDPEYRQTFSGLQMEWLIEWVPQVGYWAH